MPTETDVAVGPSILDQFRYAAGYVDKLFRGASLKSFRWSRPPGSSSSST
jgi:hypothetical protein